MPLFFTLMGAVLTRAFSWLILLWGFKAAKKIAIATSFIALTAAAFLTMAVAVKAAVVGVRVGMPPELSAFTYFLPSNINFIVATIVTVRILDFLARWSRENLKIYFSSWMNG